MPTTTAPLLRRMLILLAAPAILGAATAATPPAAGTPASLRLPEGVPPVIGCWFWSEEEFEPEGYRPFLNLVSTHADYNLLTTSLRIPKKEVTDADVRAQISAAAAYARERDIGLVVDLDVRLAREAFRAAHPGELQEMLRLREAACPDAGEVTIRIESTQLSDHYTNPATPYVAVAGRLERVYVYVRERDGMPIDAVEDMTSKTRLVSATEREVTVAISCADRKPDRRACAIAAFTHFTPDVFAPHLLDFQRSIIHGYRDAGLSGACKDEWGFPPCYDGCPAKNDFWYSAFRAREYAAISGGRDLVRDCLLMYAGERGRERERQAAINRFLEMSYLRNGAIEEDFYQATKAAFGPRAFAGTHPTWYPHPDLREQMKNGLDWWVARRDWAQTDEVTPYCARTALSKKWGSPVWYNMFYATSVGEYENAIWAGVLGGGRVNFHPLYPSAPDKGRTWTYAGLLRGGLMRGNARIRLLNFMARSPLDCPAAVVFGHACTMNWAGPAYDDPGLAAADALWAAGYPADLIPSSEIENAALRIGPDGFVEYGPQKYRAVILYHPEFCNPRVADLFGQAAKGATPLFRVGAWTMTADATAFDGNSKLPPSMKPFETGAACAAAVAACLRDRGVAPATPAIAPMAGFEHQTISPPREGRARLIDGTEIFASGRKDVAGDPLNVKLEIKGKPIAAEAVGILGVRLDDGGHLDGLAAGGLRFFSGGGVEIKLDMPADIALWRDAAGAFPGALQDWDGPVPYVLQGLCNEWLRLSVPAPP
jgi:hypothetical protein